MSINLFIIYYLSTSVGPNS